MNDLMVFQNSEFGELGVLEIAGKVYFPATKCAKALGYRNAKQAIIDHCRWVVKHDLPHPQSPDKTIEVNFIPEGDLYRLITHSRLPAAERFERWVFDEVIPTIRKTGGYQMNPNLITIDRNALATVIGITVAECIKQLKPAWVGETPVHKPISQRVERKELFTEKFNELLHKYNMTPADAARFLDKSRTSIHYWTSGKHAPLPVNLKVIADKMGVSVDFFFEE